MWKYIKKRLNSLYWNIQMINWPNFLLLAQNIPKKMDLDVLVFGSTSIEYITYLDELPMPGETTYGIHREQRYGGKGANQCVAAAKLGAKTALISKLGKDEIGKQYFEYLRGLNVNVDNVSLLDGQNTGLTELLVGENEQNTIILLSGANAMLKKFDVPRAKLMFKKAKVLICQLDTDQKAVMFALQQFKGVSILNTSPVMQDMDKNLIKEATIVCMNRKEAAQLTGRNEVKTPEEAKAAAQALLDMGAKSVIITMGDQGAVHLSSEDPNKCTHCHAATPRIVADTSGASDAFLGSLAYHIASYPNLTRESHINAANVCAASSVSLRGTQPSFPGPQLFDLHLCQTPPKFTIVGENNSNDAKSTQPLAAKPQEEPIAT